MDSLKFLLYTLGRIGVFIMVTLFATLTGKILVPAIESFVPEKSAVSQFVLNEVNCSVIAWFVVLAFMLVLFFDDGKRHAAYDIWNSINVIIVLILILLVYFVPAIFRESFHADGKGRAFYSILYFPVYWLEENLGMAYTSAAGIGAGLILVMLFAIYVISYKLYMKKHKSLYKYD